MKIFAMACWKASSEEGLNLIVNSFSCIRMTRELGGKWRHSQALARPKCLIQNVIKAHAITDTSNRESGNSQWEDSNPDLIFFTLGLCEWLEGGGVVVGSVVTVGSQQSHKYIWLRWGDVGSGGPQVNKSGISLRRTIFLDRKGKCE